MIMETYVIESTSTNPYMNLAFEEYLLNYCRIHQTSILYLWQNEKTVVVGKNQNLYTECNMNYLSERNILPARRMTGGGAVYHDLGNLNYTIIAPKKLYNIEKNTEIVVEALKLCGLEAYKNGRNDICTSKGKISGNAYYSDELVGLQHGTVLYHADVLTMEGALSVSENKLSKKGIKSVRSRISDVASQVDNVTISEIKKSIVDEFLKAFKVDKYDDCVAIDKSTIEILLEKYSSSEWIEGKNKEYSFSKKTSLSLGEVEVHLLLKGEMISEIEFYTDCMDVMFAESVRRHLHDCEGLQMRKHFPAIDITKKEFAEHRDWIVSINDFLKDVFAEIGLDYVDRQM